MDTSFRHKAGFGKRMEYSVIGKMLMDGLDVYLPLVDDHGVDCVVKKADGTFVEIQVKARSREVGLGDAALFAAIDHEPRENFFFVFVSERLGSTWILSSEDFLRECTTNKNGKSKGNRSIWFNGVKKNPKTGKREEYRKARYDKYLASDFSAFR